MIKYKKSELKNGIRVVSELHPQSRAVSIGFWVQTGTRDESPDDAGISHFLEHLVFKGTKTRSAYQIAKSLEALGGDLNAFTTREYTCYYALVLKDHWETALDVLADLVCNMQLKRKDFMLEKGVILQEIAMSEENHEEYIYDVFFDAVYAKNPLGRPILGTIKSVTEMTQKQIVEYYKNTYSGSNIIVSAAGNIDHQELTDAIAKKLKTKKKTRLSIDRKAPRWSRSRKIVEKNSEQVHMLLGFPSVSFKDKYRFESYIFNTLLGGGMTSRLYQSVREKKGLVYSIHSGLNTFTDCGQIVIYAGADQEKIQQVAEIVAKEIRKLTKQGISRSDVELFKTQVVGGILLGSDDIENRMNSIGVNEMVFEKYRSVESIVKEIEEISVESVNEFMREKFSPEQISGVLLGPGLKGLHQWWEELEF